MKSKPQIQTQVICLIMPNIFGENDLYVPNGRIVPSLFYKIMNAKKKGENISIDGSPNNQVNLIYVGDIIKMIDYYIEMKREEQIGNVIIFNQSGIIEVGDLAKRIAGIVGYEGSIHFNEMYEYKEINIMKPNISKMERIFPGFQFSEIERSLEKVYFENKDK